MRVEKAVLTLVAAAGVWSWDSRCEAATTTMKICGRNLSDIMSRVCHEYNSPTWDDPVEEQPAGVVRRRRQIGIADECCTDGCTWEQLTDYCAVSKNSESPMDTLESHLIADRSAESGTEAEAAAATAAPALSPPAVVSKPAGEVGRARSRGYGRAGKGAGAGAGTRVGMGAGTRVRQQRGRARRRHCWCRKRRTTRRRSSLMGNMDRLKNVERAAPVVGTVSPLLTWGRTLHADLAPVESDRYAFVGLYSRP